MATPRLMTRPKLATPRFGSHQGGEADQGGEAGEADGETGALPGHQGAVGEAAQAQRLHAEDQADAQGERQGQKVGGVELGLNQAQHSDHPEHAQQFGKQSQAGPAQRAIVSKQQNDDDQHGVATRDAVGVAQLLEVVEDEHRSAGDALVNGGQIGHEAPEWFAFPTVLLGENA